MAASIQMPTPCDLSLTALEVAAHMIGSPVMSDCEVYACVYSRLHARQLQGRLGFELHLIPNELMKAHGAWCLVHGSDHVWSQGVG